MGSCFSFFTDTCAINFHGFKDSRSILFMGYTKTFGGIEDDAHSCLESSVKLHEHTAHWQNSPFAMGNLLAAPDKRLIRYTFGQRMEWLHLHLQYFEVRMAVPQELALHSNSFAPLRGNTSDVYVHFCLPFSYCKTHGNTRASTTLVESTTFQYDVE